MLIYLARNKINGKEYVGQTSRTLHQRRIEHIRAAKNGCAYPFHCAIRKYGRQYFSWHVLYCDRGTLDRDDLDVLESILIIRRNTIAPNGYNLREGGDGLHAESSKKKMRVSWKGKTWEEIFGVEKAKEMRKSRSIAMRASKAVRASYKSKERNRKLSEALKGRKFSEEHRQKISEAAKKRTGEANPFYGKTHTNETRKKISKANKGKKTIITDEQRIKISKALRGRKFTDEHRQKISEAAKKRVYKPFTEEHKQRISEAAKKRWARTKAEKVAQA